MFGDAAMTSDARERWDALLEAGVRVHEADGTWTLLAHDVVRDAALDPATFSSDVSRFLQVPNGMDGAEHARFRALVDRYMTRDHVEALEPACRDIAQALVERLPRSEPVDVVGEVGAPFAVRAQMHWLGWNRTGETELLAWMDEHRTASRQRDPDGLAHVAERFDMIVRRELDARRGHDGAQDVTAELMRDTVDGQRIADEQLVSILRNWTAGDLGSIAASVGVIVHALARDTDLQTMLRALARDADAPGTARTQFDRAIDELLRIDDPFLANRRVTTREITIDGHVIPARSRIVLAWTAANRDRARFADPDAFCLHANAEHNLVYGIGPHVCPGRALATMELRSLVAALLMGTDHVSLDDASPASRSLGHVGGFDAVHALLD